MGKSMIAVIGGGAAGLTAAIAAARRLSGAGQAASSVSVTVLETQERPCRKLCVTGNGRCNLSNRKMTPDCYHSDEAEMFARLWEPCWDREILQFMSSLGVLIHERREGYLYPRTDQAQTVADALRSEARHLDIQLRCGVRILNCRAADCGYLLTGIGRADAVPGESDRPKKSSFRPGTSVQETVSLRADRVILATGGMASADYGCRGDGYRMAESLGHTVVPVHPALCALHSDAPHLGNASGIRTAAKIRLLDGGQELAAAEGELQITDRGISGIPAFQVSRFASPGSGQRLEAEIDFLPELTQEQWRQEMDRRLRAVPESDTLGDFLRGLVPDRIAVWILADRNLVREKRLRNLGPGESDRRAILQHILWDLRGKRIPVTGTDGYDRAQVTAGGVCLSELTPQLESMRCRGIYLAGELLDVDGICGGYNLTWAFHSGLLAGAAAAESMISRP